MRLQPIACDTAEPRATRRPGGAAGASAVDHVIPPERWDEILRAIPATIEPKKHPNARLDADVWHWLKTQGRGYEALMNAVLRAYMPVQRERQRSLWVLSCLARRAATIEWWGPPRRGGGSHHGEMIDGTRCRSPATRG